MRPALVEMLKEQETKQMVRKHDEAIAALATQPEFESKRVSRSMFKAMSK